MSPDVSSNVLVLAVHPDTVAATRLRATQFTPYLARAGVGVRVWSLFQPSDLSAWFGRNHLLRLATLLRGLLRIPAALMAARRASLVLVQREALPFGPPFLELVASRGRKMVWDVDDAIWEKFSSPTAGRVPQWIRGTGGKYQRLCRRADEVWAGSERLAEWCRQHNDNVRIVPTVVPVADQRAEQRNRVVSWIGSHSTGPFLEAILPVVARIDPPVKIVVVGAKVNAPPGSNVDQLPWSPAVEEEVLYRTRVGLYPIDAAHPLAEGKCGLKAILYMSRGIPPVVTPTSTNAEVVRHEVEGLHARTDDEWTAAIQRLLDDDDLWERYSEAAQARARQSFSLEVWGPRVTERVVALLEGSDA